MNDLSCYYRFASNKMLMSCSTNLLLFIDLERLLVGSSRAGPVPDVVLRLPPLPTRLFYLFYYFTDLRWSLISERFRLLLVSRNVLVYGWTLSKFADFPSPLILLTPWLRVFGPRLHSAGGFSSVLLSSRLVYASMAALPVSICC